MEACGEALCGLGLIDFLPSSVEVPKAMLFKPRRQSESSDMAAGCKGWCTLFWVVAGEGMDVEED